MLAARLDDTLALNLALDTGCASALLIRRRGLAAAARAAHPDRIVAVDGEPPPPLTPDDRCDFSRYQRALFADRGGVVLDLLQGGCVHRVTAHRAPLFPGVETPAGRS